MQYLYELPQFHVDNSLLSKLENGWGFSGVMVFESGQPYKVYDFSGSVGSIYYSADDYITNPIVNLAPGQTGIRNSAGHPGATPPSLNPSALLSHSFSLGKTGSLPAATDGTDFATP